MIAAASRAAASRAAESAPVTQWGPRLLLTVVVVAVIGLGVWGMRRGWRAREARQGDLPAPLQAPAGALGQPSDVAVSPVAVSDVAVSDAAVVAKAAAPDDAAPEDVVAGLYVATTTAGDLLDRIVAHGLGHRGRATLRATDEGVLIRRVGEVDLWIPRTDLRGVRLGNGQAQKAFEAGGLILISWQLGGRVLDTGFRADEPALHIATARALSALVPTT